MKPVYLFALVVFFLFSSCDYTPGVSEAFTKYRFKNGVTAITVPGWVIGLAAQFADVDEEGKDLLNCIDKVRVLSVENKDLNDHINLHKEFSTKINRNGDYEELMNVQDEKQQITIYGKMKDNVISEMVVLVGGDDNALIYLKGEIDPKMINDVVKISDNEKLLSFKF